MIVRLFVALALVACSAQSAPKRAKQVLFLTHSAGYRHKVVTRANPAALSFAEKQLVDAAKGEFEITATQDCRTLTRKSLQQYAAIVFYTTGELPLNPQLILDFVRRGGGFVGIHPATDTFYKSAPYMRMVGGTFNGHPWHQEVNVLVEDGSHMATRHLGEAFRITDEIYQFRNWARRDVHVLLRLDIGSIDLKKKGVRRTDGDFALSWCKRHGAGRVFYTALGHRPEVWKDRRFLDHVLGGLRWATAGPATDAEGFVTLYGPRSGTDGWKQAGPGGFRHSGSTATAAGGMGLWYYDQTYRNFQLRVEFLQNKPNANAGVFVRFPRVDGDPWLPVREGHEIQIHGDTPGKSSTGAVYTFAAPKRLPLRPGLWNAYEITCIGPRYWVRLNGELITTYQSDRSLTGMIGLQNHNADGKGDVSFRNVRIRELPDQATAFHELFGPGADDGWRMCGPGEFRRVDGTLMATGGMGMLWHEKKFRDFILMLDWKTTRAEDNSGVFVRFPDPGNDPMVAVNEGYEIQICDAAQARHRTGSVYSFQDATSMPVRKIGAWNHYEIRVVGQRYTIKLNGTVVNEFLGSRSAAGHIGIQNHDDGSPVRFKNIRVIELK